MIHRRNFLASLALAFPFGRALAGSLPIVSDVYTIGFTSIAKAFVVTTYTNGDVRAMWGGQPLGRTIKNEWHTFSGQFGRDRASIRVKKGDKSLMVDWVMIETTKEDGDSELTTKMPCRNLVRDMACW